VACPLNVSRRVLIGAVVFVVLDVNKWNEPAGIVNKVHLLGKVLAELFNSIDIIATRNVIREEVVTISDELDVII
jgi:hypothetical protein